MYCKLLRSQLSGILQVWMAAKRPARDLYAPERVFFVQIICMENHELYMNNPFYLSDQGRLFRTFALWTNTSSSHNCCVERTSPHINNNGLCVSAPSVVWQTRRKWTTMLKTTCSNLFVKVPQTVPPTSWNTSGTSCVSTPPWGGETLPLCPKPLLCPIKSFVVTGIRHKFLQFWSKHFTFSYHWFTSHPAFKGLQSQYNPSLIIGMKKMWLLSRGFGTRDYFLLAGLCRITRSAE